MEFDWHMHKLKKGENYCLDFEIHYILYKIAFLDSPIYLTKCIVIRLLLASFSLCLFSKQCNICFKMLFLKSS